MKRKHKSGTSLSRASKKRKQSHDKTSPASKINHSVLSTYFDNVVSLRDFVLERLSERVKSKKLAKLIQFFKRKGKVESDDEFHQFLDSVVVTSDKHVRWTDETARKRDFVAFSQACSQAFPATVPSTIGQDIEPKADLQIEVVNYVIWSLFRYSPRNEHLLCQGFGGASSASTTFHSAIPNIVCHYPNGHVETLTNRCWCHLLSTLGKGGEVLMADILSKCSIFMPTAATGQERGNYYQLSGIPLSTIAKTVKSPKNLEPERPTDANNTTLPGTRNKLVLVKPRTPSEIRLVRNRIFYSRPTFNSKGRVRLGLRHVHVLNRYTDLSRHDEAIHIAKYIFPRQFGLHNVFTSTVDPRETTQPFKDYTIREREIEELATKSNAINKLKLPKRLRNGPIELIGKIRKSHQQISYVELLRHYCPINQTALDECSNQGSQSDIISCFATPVSNCAAFVKAVFNHFVPSGCFGQGDDGKYNHNIILDAVELFVRRRKFESLTLHDILQKIRIAAIPWLRPPNAGLGESNLSKTDFDKRKELLSEFVYWLFDSYLIPLIRSNFHVTESNKDKNRLYYFRLDVWHQLTSPAFAQVKTSMYEEMPSITVKKLLSIRRLGYSNLRLLPKSNTFRPIMNLRRRPEYINGSRRLLGQSINSLLNPVYKALHYEAFRVPNTLGSSLLSVSAIHPALKSFKTLLASKNLAGKPLYFAKIDVKSCFDSLPQSKVLELATNLLATTKYALTKHAEVSPPQIATHSSALKHRVRYIATGHSTKRIARAGDDAHGRLDDHGRKDTVYVSPLNRQVQMRDALLKLLREHVQRNVVKIGKKFYRQNKGVPQGSVVSSILCSLAYTALESTELAYIKESGNSVLLRLIDDFLVITTDKNVAMRFLETMCAGVPAFGVEVKRSKSLVNFDAVIGGEGLARVDILEFPYCGILINTQTLDVTKDVSSINHSSICNSLTIDSSMTPGQTFRLKALNGLPIHLHTMYFDTEHNSLRTVLGNVHRTFVHAALRMYHYVRGLSARQRPSLDIISATIRDMVGLVYGIVRNRVKRWMVSKMQVKWLASKAFLDVVSARQTNMGGLVAWLETEMLDSWPTRGVEARLLRDMVRDGELVMDMSKMSK